MDDRLIDASDMLAVHRVFRDAFGSPGEIVGRAGEDGARGELVRGYLANVLALLAVHHEGEDELVWPRVAERAPEAADLVAAMTSEHAGMHTSLDAATAALDAWDGRAGSPSAAALVATLESLDASLVAHLDHEEAEAIPVIERVLTQEEYAGLPQHGSVNFTGDKLWLVLGLIRENMTSEQLSHMDASLPPPAKEFWDTTGQPLFTDYVTALRA